MSKAELLPFEFDSNSTPQEINESLLKYNFAKLNGTLKAKIPLLDDLRDAIEIADFFQLNYQSSTDQNSNKDLVLNRFSDVSKSRKIPNIKLPDLPFGIDVGNALLTQKPFPSLFQVHMPKAKKFYLHTSVLRPAQNANSNRTTEWKWHQDIKFHNSLDDFSIWIPLVSCGVEAPGLQFLITPNLKTTLDVDSKSPWCLAPNLQESMEKDFDVYAPRFNLGDCIIFNSYAVHKTFALPEMIKERTSIDLRVTFSKIKKHKSMQALIHS